MAMRLNTPLPDLSGASQWINGRPDLAGLAGRPVLVHFWSVSCQLCHANLPTVARWRDSYAPLGLAVVAVHIPRAQNELDVERVRAATAELGITEPCAVDNAQAIKAGFVTSYVPAYFLFDRAGRLRARSGGAVGAEMLEQSLAHQFAAPEAWTSIAATERSGRWPA